MRTVQQLCAGRAARPEDGVDAHVLHEEATALIEGLFRACF